MFTRGCRAVGKPRIRTMLVAVRAKVTEGYTLSDSLGDYPHVFDELFRSMVAAGEKSGHLDSVLERLADYAENRQKMRSKLQQAMIYPVVLVVFAVGIVAFLLAAVVPKIVGQFVQMGQALLKHRLSFCLMPAISCNIGGFRCWSVS
ncbi:type II secretion system F family protein [Vibrio cholerae]